MTSQNQQKINDRNKFNQAAAAVTGAVIGAGVGVAGAVILGDKNNRKKIKKVFTNIKDQAVDYVEGMQKQAEVKKDEVEKKFAEGKNKVNKVVNSTKESLHHVVKGVKDAVK